MNSSPYAYSDSQPNELQMTTASAWAAVVLSEKKPAAVRPQSLFPRSVSYFPRPKVVLSSGHEGSSYHKCRTGHTTMRKLPPEMKVLLQNAPTDASS